MSLIDSLVPLYTYCETAQGVIPQPLNFLSCAVFWLGAVWMWHTQTEDDESPSFHQVSAILMFILGLTGMVWHVGGAQIMLALDMFFLFMLFVIIAVVVSNDLLRWSMGKGLTVLVMLIIMSALLKDQSLGMLPQNGGLFLPILFFLAIAALKLQTINEEVTVYLLSASYLLFFGLLARSADSLLCSYFPQGLHFLWHTLIVFSVIYVGKTLVAMKDVKWPEEAKS